jgi:hypothetical protein
VAKDKAEPNTPPPAPAIPKPDWLFLNEAAALVISLVRTFDAAGVQAALGRALEEGRLHDRPEFGDSSHPDAWRRRIEAGAINWETGEIRFRMPSRDGGWVVPPPIRPQLRRQDVLALFGITEAPPSAAAPDQPARTTTAAEEADKKATSTEPRIYQQIRELTNQEFPDGHENVATGVIIDRVSKRLQKGQPVPSRDTFNRALGRRKS